MKNKKISELKKMTKEEKDKMLKDLKVELIKSKTNKSPSKKIKKMIAQILSLNK